MRLDNIVGLLGATLKNAPAITNVQDFSADLQQVRRGTLFFAKKKSDVPEAIKRGAYAIVYEGWIQITDSEIAWIKVEDLRKAAIRLLRFLIIQKQIPLIALDPIALDLARTLIIDKKVSFFEDPFKALEKLEDSSLLLCPLKIAQDLSIQTRQIPIKEPKIIQSYLFETTFIHKDRLYERALLPILFWPEFGKVLSIIDSYDLDWSIANLENFGHFKPIFLGQNYEVVEFGKSDRVLILESSKELLDREREYLIQKASWSDHLFLAKTPYQKEGFLKFGQIDELKKILYNTPSRFILLYARFDDIDIEKIRRHRIEKTFF